MPARTAHRDPWPARLRRALDEDLFELHFQPIVCLRDGTVHMSEALLRLADRPGRPPVVAGRFLPAAERLGLIRELDRMVLAKACEILAAGLAEPGTVAVNLSAVSVADDAMPAVFERTLRRHGVEPERLVVELTETAAITDMARARTFCSHAEALGCAVALDDFGSGWGSLQYLKHLPFTYLKIDGSFVSGLVASRVDQLVVRALVGIVSGLGRLTVAEYVGDTPTLEMLRAYGVDYAQGYAVGVPQPLLAAAA
jgi:EAL domain-containing protein (putative c-di-GMP-specific phosphodiesterase class I)